MSDKPKESNVNWEDKLMVLSLVASMPGLAGFAFGWGVKILRYNGWLP